MRILASLWLLAACAAFASAESRSLGPNACKDCHAAEFDVWKESKHGSSFRTVHRSPVAKEILAAVGGPSNMRAHPACVQCHFTGEQAEPAAKAEVASSVSCERCHGAASDWLKLHNDLGGAKEKETKEHAAKRREAARKAGWISPDMVYELASGCNSCHGLSRPGVEDSTIAKMLAAGHPFDSGWELVKYSQGSVRHRFYSPDPSVNAELDAAGRARLFVTGQAAKLVSADRALAGSKNEEYKAAQARRAESARTALSALKSVPEAQALLAAPTEENARKLVAAIAGKDLSAELADELPSKDEVR